MQRENSQQLLSPAEQSSDMQPTANLGLPGTGGGVPPVLQGQPVGSSNQTVGRGHMWEGAPRRQLEGSGDAAPICLGGVRSRL